jgi:tRNA pseudouridine38-40 synthase
MRYFFEIAYHGGEYSGWQSQANALSVQEVMETTLSKLFRGPVKIIGSSRTDTGVHCRQQFFQTDIDGTFDLELMCGKLNSFLPRSVAVRSIRKVKPGATARYSARERSYEYWITTVKNPFLEGLAWHYFKNPDIQTMNKAAALLVGTQDFECFSKVKTDVNQRDAGVPHYVKQVFARYGTGYCRHLIGCWHKKNIYP